MQLKTLTPASIKNKHVLVRVDYNVPLEKSSGGSKKVANDARIVASLPTIEFLLKNKAQVILISHLGRPEGRPNPDYTLKPVADHLEKLIKKPVRFVENWYQKGKKSAEPLPADPLILLENCRFYPEEEENSKALSEYFAEIADVYVNEAFSAAHRAHATTEGVTHFLPSCAGFALAEEVEALSSLMTKPARPFVMVVGGAKISDKVSAITNLTKIADVVLVGGGVANNFLKADGFEIAHSYLQDTPADLKKKGVNYVDVAGELIESTKQERLLLNGYIPLPKIMYPIDVVAASSMESRKTQVIDLVNNGHELKGKKELIFLDIGPKTIKLFKEVILSANTVFWNGPMGVFEKSQFAKGTEEVAKAVAKTAATTILGGGDTIAAAQQSNLLDRFDYVSAAGGASLAFLSGTMLPGIKPLLVRSTAKI
jgi:phosphoglycerate kinase